MNDLTLKLSVASFTDTDVVYSVDVALNTCTCMKWKYQRVPVGQRTCKHLDRVRVQTPSAVPSITTYPSHPVEDNFFQLVTHSTPSSLPAGQYVYSIKFDGIRVRITGQMATTRGGMTIDLTSMKLPFLSSDEDIEYDAELIHMDRSGHAHVMQELYANRLDRLSVRVFDVIDTARPFDERQTSLDGGAVVAPYRVEYHPVEGLGHLADVVLRVLATGAEGIVVRNLQGTYAPGQRSRYNAFKVKKPLSPP